MPEDEIYFEGVAKKLQQENESLRIEILKYRHAALGFDLGHAFDELMEWVEHHYLFVICCAIVLSYTVTCVIDVTGAWRKYHG